MGMRFCLRTLESQYIMTTPSYGVDDNDDTGLHGNMGWVCGKLCKGGTNISMLFDVGWKSALEKSPNLYSMP